MLGRFGSTRVEIVPDDDAEAQPDIPKAVLAALGTDEVLMSKTGHMMYLRASLWERIKHRFPPRAARGER